MSDISYVRHTIVLSDEVQARENLLGAVNYWIKRTTRTFEILTLNKFEKDFKKKRKIWAILNYLDNNELLQGTGWNPRLFLLIVMLSVHSIGLFINLGLSEWVTLVAPCRQTRRSETISFYCHLRHENLKYNDINTTLPGQ